MPKYTLHYFDVRGRGELARLIFAQAGQEFTDHRWKMENWQEEKENNKHRYPFGVSPTLEVDGKIIPESHTIARYLASEFGLAGKDNWERARCDAVVDLLKDVVTELIPLFYLKETDEAKIAKMRADIFEGKVATKLEALEEYFKVNNDGKGFFVGDSVTWADLALSDLAFKMLAGYPSVFDKRPLLKALHERVMALPNVKKHCETRPVTSA